MLTDTLPDPFLWLSHHQWGILLSGFTGNLIGALLGAVVTVFVLVKTLGFQRRQFAKDIETQAEAASIQLRSVSTQIAAQAELSSLGREIEARSLVIRYLSLMDREARRDRSLPEHTDRELATAITRWRLELAEGPDHALWTELGAWGDLPAAVIRLSYSQRGLDEWEVFGRVADALTRTAINFRRQTDGTLWDAGHCAQVLREGRALAERYIADGARRQTGQPGKSSQ